MVVWARSAPEKQKTVTTQTAQSQIPRFPQSHRLRIFAPWISVDHHWQNSGFFGFFLALAAEGLLHRQRRECESHPGCSDAPTSLTPAARTAPFARSSCQIF